MPHASQVCRWLDANEIFREQYARARERQADTLFDQILTIADEEKEDVQRSRLRVDARRWMAGKMRPKVYGDKLEHTGEVRVPVTFQTVYEPKPDS
jgi:hypothetical protein